MPSSDLEYERQRLSQLYADMSDGELELIGKDSGALTDIAQQALHDELGRRRLSITVEEPVAPPDTNSSNSLVTVGQFRDLPEAFLAKGILDSAGITCFLIDENMIRVNWFLSNLLGGIKIQVNREDAEASEELLNQPIPDRFDVEGVGEYVQPNCPRCHSLEVGYEELDKPFAYGTAWVGFPLPFHRRDWKCHSCGHQWAQSNNTEAQI
jgi:hypothetical protein